MNLTEQVMRSLLQKAVRRGHTETIQQMLQYFYRTDETRKNLWIRNRMPIIAAEECWPMLDKINTGNSDAGITHYYTLLAQAQKNKDAAGLGNLALAYKDNGIYVPTDPVIIGVAQSINKPKEFWEDPGKFNLPVDKLTYFQKAEEAYKRCTQEGDKATIIAAAYLRLRDGIPEQSSILSSDDTEFPYWVAFDRHTALGTDAITSVAKSLGINPSMALWLAFYQEGSVCSNTQPTPWWDLYLDCCYYAYGMKRAEANETWVKLSPLVKEKLEPRVERLKESLSEYSSVPELQLSLF